MMEEEKATAEAIRAGGSAHRPIEHRWSWLRKCKLDVVGESMAMDIGDRLLIIALILDDRKKTENCMNIRVGGRSGAGMSRKRR